LPKANARFHTDKKQIQYDGYPQHFSHLPIIGSHMMMVVMVMFVVLVMFMRATFFVMFVF
jgi:hypothetical protein